MFNKIHNYWRSLTPEAKRYYKLSLFFVFIVIIAAISVLSAQKNKSFSTAIQKTKDSTTYLRSNLHNMSRAAQAAETQHLENEISRLQGVVAAQNNITTTQLQQDEKHLNAKVLEKLRHSRIEVTGMNPEMVQQIRNLQHQLKENQAQIAYLKNHPVVVQPSAPAPQATTPEVVNQVPSTAQNLIIQGSLAPSSAASNPGHQIKLQLANDDNGSTPPPSKPSETMHLSMPHLSAKMHQKKTDVVKVSSKDSIYLPAGSIITGVTLNGVDAPTGPGARDTQQIVDIRVKKDAILPNNYRSSIKNCDIIASGYGSIDSRRVFLRTNELSCVSNNGGIISAPIKGYIVGSDGMVGIRGTMISHQDSKLMKSFLAGLLSGIGGSGAPTQVSPLNVNPGNTQQFQLPNPEYMGWSALSGGVSTAAGQVSKFYLDEAKAMQPVIQINPAISVSIILEYGAKIHLQGNTKRQIQETDYQVSSAMNNQQSAPPTAQQDIQNGDITGAMPGFGAPTTASEGYPPRPGAPESPAYAQTSPQPAYSGQP